VIALCGRERKREHAAIILSVAKDLVDPGRTECLPSGNDKGFELEAKS